MLFHLGGGRDALIIEQVPRRTSRLRHGCGLRPSWRHIAAGHKPGQGLEGERSDRHVILIEPDRSEPRLDWAGRSPRRCGAERPGARRPLAALSFGPLDAHRTFKMVTISPSLPVKIWATFRGKAEKLTVTAMEHKYSVADIFLSAFASRAPSNSAGARRCVSRGGGCGAWSRELER